MPFVSKHLEAVPVWFSQEPLDTSDGWTETPAVGQQIIAIKSVLYSDGSARRWYRMGKTKGHKKAKNMTKTEAKAAPISKSEATKLMKAAKRRLGKRVKETR
jgi:hypothetical protein